MTARWNDRMTNQVFGLGLMTAAAAVMLVVTLFLLDPVDAPTAAVLSIILGSVTYLVWRFDTVWTAVLGLLVALGAAMTVFYIAFGISHLFSPIEFIAALLLVVGFVFAMAGGVGALIRHRHQSLPGGVLIRKWALVLLGVGAVVSIVGFFATRSTIDAAEASEAILVDIQDFQFEPEAVSIGADGQLLFTNSDPFAHNFTLDEFDLYIHFGPGNDALVDLSGLPPGTYPYYCSLHTFDGEGMTGTLTIEAAGSS